MKMEQCSETSAYNIQTPGKHAKVRIQNRYIIGRYKSGYLELLSSSYGLDCPGFETRWVQEIFCSPCPSKSYVGCTR